MSAVPIDGLRVASYRIPTDRPESDGTLSWNSTTLVLVEVTAGGRTGIGYTYSQEAAALLVDQLLAEVVLGRDAMQVRGSWNAMRHAVRNLGRPGLASAAIAAVDVALWDLKGRLLEQPLVVLLDGCRTSVPAYGSGGFTSYSDRELEQQFAGFAAQGLRWVKMKVGREPGRDLARVTRARAAIGDGTGLMVDANGAWQRKQALQFAHEFAAMAVSWLEEPVPADDLEGLRLLRDCGPPGMEIAAGEYGWELDSFRRLLDAGAVDVLQADATRCQGITGFLAAAALCTARGLELSAHTAPTLHAHAGCAAGPLRHVEYFHDHARIEAMLFDGALQPEAGELRPDPSRPGLGIEWKRADAEPFLVWQGERRQQRRALAAAGKEHR